MSIRYKAVQLEDILAACCLACGVSQSEFGGKCRTREAIAARELFAGISKKLTTRTWPDIAAACGKSHPALHQAAIRYREGMAKRGVAYIDSISGQAHKYEDLTEEVVDYLGTRLLVPTGMGMVGREVEVTA